MEKAIERGQTTERMKVRFARLAKSIERNRADRLSLPAIFLYVERHVRTGISCVYLAFRIVRIREKTALRKRRHRRGDTQTTPAFRQ